MAFSTFSGNQDDPLCDPDWVDQSDPHLPDNLLQDIHQILKNFPPENTIDGSSLTTNGGSCSPENDSNDAEVQSECTKTPKKKTFARGKKAPVDWTRYRGIRRRPWGKFAAEVTNPMKKRTRATNPMKKRMRVTKQPYRYRKSKTIGFVCNLKSSLCNSSHTLLMDESLIEVEDVIPNILGFDTFP